MTASEKVKNPWENSYFPGYGEILGNGDIGVLGSGIFGQWTKEDQALFNLQMANAQWQANLSLIDYQNEYNSPKEQVKRMREAGLNPDLLGTEAGGVSSSGAPTPSSIAPDGRSNFDVLGGIFSAFSTAMSVANGLMSFKSAQESLDSQILDNVNKVDGFATSFLVDNLVPESFSSDKQLLGDTRTNLISQALSWSRKNYGFSKRQARRFQDAVIRKMDSPDFLSQFYDTINKSETARQEYLTKTSGDLYSQADDTMRILLDEVIKEQNRYNRSFFKAGSEKNKYDSEAFSSMNPRNFAERENLRLTQESSEIRRNLYGASFSYYTNKRLYNAYKKGNTFAGIVLSLSKGVRDTRNALLGTIGNIVK